MSSLLDADCRDGKHGSCFGGPCQCSCHEQPQATRDLTAAEAGVLRAALDQAAARDGEGMVVAASTGVFNRIQFHTTGGVRLELSWPAEADRQVPAELDTMIARATDQLAAVLRENTR